MEAAEPAAEPAVVQEGGDGKEVEAVADGGGASDAKKGIKRKKALTQADNPDCRNCHRWYVLAACMATSLFAHALQLSIGTATRRNLILWNVLPVT